MKLSSIKNYIKAYLAMLITLGVLEYFWFIHIITDFVNNKLGHVMADEARYVGVLLFYIFYPAAVSYFALKHSNDYKKAIVNGAFFGFAVYFVYETTNYAIISDWPLSFSIIDVIWGTAITGLISAVGFKVKNR